MRQLGQMKKSTKNSLFTYTLVIAAFVVVQALRMGPGVGAMLEGQLIPICAYIVMALALNLVVGVSGELSLGHAGFMSIGAFAGSALAWLSRAPSPFPPCAWPWRWYSVRSSPPHWAFSSASPCCASMATIWPL